MCKSVRDETPYRAMLYRNGAPQTADGLNYNGKRYDFWMYIFIVLVGSLSRYDNNVTPDCSFSALVIARRWNKKNTETANSIEILCVVHAEMHDDRTIYLKDIEQYNKGEFTLFLSELEHFTI